MSARAVQQKFHPTATVIRVYYGVRWLMLKTDRSRHHPTLNTYWIPAEHPRALDDFYNFRPDTNALLFIDPTVTHFQGILIEGQECILGDDSIYGTLTGVVDLASLKPVDILKRY